MTEVARCASKYMVEMRSKSELAEPMKCCSTSKFISSI